MDTTETAESPAADKKYLTVRQAAFIGVGAMVGAGIFALLGAAGEVAGAAVWLTYLANAIVTAMVAVSFGSYATSTFAGENQTWIKAFAALIIIVMTGVNIAIVAAGAVFVTFVFTTLIHEPASIATLLVIVVLSIGLDYGWKRSRPSSPVPVQVGP
jgi:hypothetical protein